MSKLKNHWIAGVTMTMKNNFGLTPCSLYGGDAGPSGNEDPRQERGPVGHNGNRTPPKGVPQELHPDSPREPGYRVPRIVVDLCAVRPVDLSIVDGIETIRGGEGEWNQGIEKMTPGLLIVGTEPGVHRRRLHGGDGLRSACRRAARVPLSGATTRSCSRKRRAWARPT